MYIKQPQTVVAAVSTEFNALFDALIIYIYISVYIYVCVYTYICNSNSGMHSSMRTHL